jgi:hypothetical protein
LLHYGEKIADLQFSDRNTKKNVQIAICGLTKTIGDLQTEPPRNLRICDLQTYTKLTCSL